MALGFTCFSEIFWCAGSSACDGQAGRAAAPFFGGNRALDAINPHEDIVGVAKQHVEGSLAAQFNGPAILAEAKKQAAPPRIAYLRPAIARVG